MAEHRVGVRNDHHDLYLTPALRTFAYGLLEVLPGQSVLTGDLADFQTSYAAALRRRPAGLVSHEAEAVVRA